MKKITAVFIYFLLTSIAFTQYVNFRLYSSGTQQIEPSISRHPHNPLILFASAYTINGGVRSEGIYVSTNGGINWTGTDICNGQPIQNHAGDPGPVIDKNGIFILTHLGTLPQGSMQANYSTDQGANWSNNVAILTGDLDKGAPATDGAASSSFYGRTYLAFTNFVSPFRIVLSYTSNSGVNWSGVINVNNSLASHISVGPAIVTDNSGTVFVSWASSVSSSPFTEDFVGFAKSTNGGINWSVNESAIDCNGIRTNTLSPWQIRANSFPAMDVDKTGGPRNGWIYIAITNKNFAPAGTDPDVVLHRSTDNGSTWSAGVRVNQDPLNNGRNQFFPAMRVDEDGGLNIIYFDSRNSADSLDVYLSRSTDGGFTFTDYRITSSRFYPVPASGAGGQGNMGDNLGITSGNGKLYPVWMANYTGNFQVWSAIIDYTTIGVKQISNEIPQSFTLSQNYPNPFNPGTKIRFQIPESGNVKIIVYDAMGRELETLINENLKAGTFETNWNASLQPSGVYFYKMIAEGYSETRKMVLVK